MKKVSIRNIDGYLIVTAPYNERFLEQLKATIPIEDREWCGEDREWYINDDHAAYVRALIRKCYRCPIIDDQGLVDEVRTLRAKCRALEQDYAELLDQMRTLRDEYWELDKLVGRCSCGPLSGDYATLCLQDNAPIAVVHAVYKALVVMHHPDRGGDTATMQRINAARDRILNTKNGGR
jgi:hypothetical protein